MSFNCQAFYPVVDANSFFFQFSLSGICSSSWPFIGWANLLANVIPSRSTFTETIRVKLVATLFPAVFLSSKKGLMILWWMYTHLVSPKVDSTSGHHLRQLGHRDGHRDKTRDSVMHSLERVIRVHERMDGKVHGNEPTCRSSVLGKGIPKYYSIELHFNFF